MQIILKIYINLVVFFKLVVTDCGLPAIPYNAHIDRVQQIYFEGESIEYHCQLEDLKLVGASKRKCVNSRWNGTIPRCVEELNFGTISAIDLADTRNHTFEYESRSWHMGPQSAAYHADSRREKCLQARKMSRPHTWKIHLTKAERHISYIEIKFLDSNNKLSKTDASKIIKAAKVNEMRDCDSAILDTSESTVQMGLTCFMEFEGDSVYEVWEKDQTQIISLDFDIDVISICEIRIYKNSFMPFNRCGSADIVLHSSHEFIKSGTRYNGGSYYKYSCDKGFKLEGGENVRCGLNNYWLDEFPTCKPEVTCPYPPSTHQSISVDINYEHLYSFEGNLSAIEGSVVSYFCVGDYNTTVMIGDSVRVCGADRKWTGLDPICIHIKELNADLFKDIQNDDQNDKQMTTFEIFDKYVDTFNQSALSCGIPAMPLFAKPTSGSKYRLFGGQADLRPFYENGSVINYQCESAYRWVAGDVSKRTCVNGSWVGRVGKCAINWGNRVSLNSIYVYNLSKKTWVDDQLIFETNSTNQRVDQHFAYRRDADKEGECAKFKVDDVHKWVLRLNQSVSITYFTVMLHPGGFFGNKHKIDDPKILETTAVTASIGEQDCVLTSAWDYTHSMVGTYFFFTCDMDERKSDYVSYGYDINLQIDPKRFDKSYTSKNISLCSLAVLLSKNDCGSPDIPLHSSVSLNQATNGWTYTCDEGYQLNGPETVVCGRNGRWSDEFPKCVKGEMCPITDLRTKIKRKKQTNYKNLMEINGKQTAVIDSLVNYSCFSRKNKKILIGSHLRVCTKSGQWSGTEPYCMNINDLPQSNKEPESRSAGSVFGIILAVVTSMALIITGVWFVFHRGYLAVPKMAVPNFSIPKIKIERGSSVNSFGSGREVSTIETPTDINANDPFSSPVDKIQDQLPKQKSTRINEVLPVFATGNELLIEPDIDDD